MNMCSHFQAELASSFAVIQQQMNLEIRCLDTNHIQLAELLDESVCQEILHDFATRIHAKNLTCASSLFIKYWSTIWILPFLYCQAAAVPFVKWQSSALAVNLPEGWYWDRTLQLVDSKSLSLQIMTLKDIESMLTYFNLLFIKIARVGRVPYALLWENAAVRVVQLYRSLAQQNLTKEMQDRLQQQQCLLRSRSASSFNLTENPFLQLWNNWHPEFKTYMRKKCCFYFQLEQAEQKLCSNCPLQVKDLKENKL
ncbi:(2Fe-2S)-binding protein [Acinetobacter sp. ANC 3882]|uniref:(2Fe-2S)-binding protein n=1 Tax=Acinetobacter sp. ANC 3882 TaxID=2923423 RepID=UPI001F4B754B|nr:(2Fe-2S)-binding protein [Acinetobacter sp. ANC 3882]MCH7313192.1 (2Fe-2S)-binding protein [Acinetobacter sp. ANC 3882]